MRGDERPASCCGRARVRPTSSRSAPAGSGAGRRAAAAGASRCWRRRRGCVASRSGRVRMRGRSSSTAASAGDPSVCWSADRLSPTEAAVHAAPTYRWPLTRDRHGADTELTRGRHGALFSCHIPTHPRPLTSVNSGPRPSGRVRSALATRIVPTRRAGPGRRRVGRHGKMPVSGWRNPAAPLSTSGRSRRDRERRTEGRELGGRDPPAAAGQAAGSDREAPARHDGVPSSKRGARPRREVTALWIRSSGWRRSGRRSQPASARSAGCALGGAEPALAAVRDAAAAASPSAQPARPTATPRTRSSPRWSGRQHDPHAARVVLQALLPGLKALAGRLLLDAGRARRGLVGAARALLGADPPLPARAAAGADRRQRAARHAASRPTRELKRQRRDRDERPADARRSGPRPRPSAATSSGCFAAQSPPTAISERGGGADPAHAHRRRPTRDDRAEIGIAYHALNDAPAARGEAAAALPRLPGCDFRGPKAAYL